MLISFTDAKVGTPCCSAGSLAHRAISTQMSLLEWTPSAHDFLPVSLHTFEKLPQVVSELAACVRCAS